MGRKSLSDITNLTSNGRMARSDVSDGQVSAKAAAPSASSKDYIAHLLKENATLMMHLRDRDKIIELNSVEMQKLRFLVHNSNKQNQQLARSNSQMLAERNVDKDRLKTLHHELGCMSAVLNVKNSELKEKNNLIEQLREAIGAEEKNNLIEQLREAIGAEKITEEHSKLNSVAEDAPIPAGHKKACSPKRKHALRNQSLGSATGTNQATAKGKGEIRRRSLRRRSSDLKSELNDPTEDLFEIEVVEIVDVESPIRSLAANDKQSSDRVDSSAPLVSNASWSSFKEEQKDHSGPLQIRRRSIARPMRRAAEKVSSYKEERLNAKLRRPD